MQNCDEETFGTLIRRAGSASQQTCALLEAPRGSEVHLVMEMVWKCRMQIETTHPQIDCYKQSSPVADLLFISCSDTSTWWRFVGKPLPPFINIKGSFGTFYLMRCFVSFSIYVKQCFLFVKSFPSEFQFLLVCKSLDLHTHTRFLSFLRLCRDHKLIECGKKKKSSQLHI